MKNTIECTKSVRVAIGFLAALIFGKKTLYTLYLDKKVHRLPIPKWEFFDWFNLKEIGPTHEEEPWFIEGSNFQVFSRNISFYGYKKKLLAKIWLEGIKLIDNDRVKPNLWRVKKIKYLLHFNPNKMNLRDKWHQVEFTAKDCPFKFSW